jgi:hypothetical protein
MNASENEPKLKKIVSVAFSVIAPSAVLTWLANRSYETSFLIGASVLLLAAVAVLLIGKFCTRDGPISDTTSLFTRVSVVPGWLSRSAWVILALDLFVCLVVWLCFWPLTPVAAIEQFEPAMPAQFVGNTESGGIELFSAGKLVVARRGVTGKVRIETLRLFVTTLSVKDVRLITTTLPGNVVTPNEFRAKLTRQAGVVVAQMHDGDKPVAGTVVVDDSYPLAEIRVEFSGEAGAYLVRPEVTVRDESGRVRTLTTANQVAVYVVPSG